MKLEKLDVFPHRVEEGQLVHVFLKKGNPFIAYYEGNRAEREGNFYRFWNVGDMSEFFVNEETIDYINTLKSETQFNRRK